MPEITFLDPGHLQDRELILRLRETDPGDGTDYWVPSYRFDMVHDRTGDVMGYINLRPVHCPMIDLYIGHIGYEVNPQFRGRHYAARASRLLLPLATLHRVDPIWITCNPENIPSRRTIERIGGELYEIIDIPTDSELYREGLRQKCRYRVPHARSGDLDG